MAAKDIIALGIGPATSPAITFFLTFGLDIGAQAAIWTPTSDQSTTWTPTSDQSTTWTPTADQT